ncbi:MAG TPA: HDIG domain-containing protein [Thermoanaerobaculia bacterium]|nr:HDIG domain-containing protein [Thermoanaerobaculia bacterium]
MSTGAPPGRTTIDFQKTPPPPSREDGERPAVRVRPLLWAIAYVVATTLCFSPTLSFRDRPAVPGMIAPRDIVAPRDLIVPDPDATARRRAESSAEVLPIYDYDATAPARFESQLRESFEKARTTFARTRPKGRVTPELANAFALPIGDEALAALARQGFSPRLEDQFAVIGLDLYRGGVIDHRDLPPEARSRGITARDTSTGRESRRRESGAVEFGNEARSAIASRLADSPFTPRERAEVAAFLAATLRPNLVYDAPLTAERRADAARGVESVFTRLPRGKVIVRRGDEITPRTAQWIAAIRASASDPSSWVKVTGILILQVLAAAAFWLDARRQRRRRRERSPGVVFGSVLATGIVFAFVTRATYALAQALSPSLEGASGAVNFAIPFAAGPIVVSLVAGMGPALLVALVFSLGAGVLMGLSFPFALFAVVGSLAGIYGLGRVGARSVLLAMGGVVAAGNLVAIVALHFLNAGPWGWDFLFDALAGVAGGLTVSMVVALLLPVFEHLFSVVTDIRLLELSNQNLPLLRTLALEAPGSYQHSLMLGHLAEAAAEAIGADSLLARVSGYYHDIGKTKMPDYFIENQAKGYNRHDRLEPSMSALIIAAHVKEGVEMARRARLPEPIVTAIREHHGTKLIRYFFQKAVSRAAPGEDVSETEYRYPGPKPSTRILGILMIADAVEAASRTLIEPTPAKIRAMIRQIVDDCLRDGQFDECDLTMRDLSVIVEALERTVNTVFHHRIDYPGFDFNRERSRRRSADTATGPRAV